MKISIHFWIIISCLLTTNFLFGQSPDCINAFTSPMCGAIAPYPANSTGTGSGTGPQAPAGNNYDCLGTQGNPNFFTITIDQTGPIDFTVDNSNNVDIDFVLWGPYNSINEAQSYCGNLGNGAVAPSAPNVNQIADCSYSIASAEPVNIANAQSGEIYVLMVTNYANTPTNIFTSGNTGTGTLACPCQLDYYGFTMLGSPINVGGQLIDTSGGFGQYLVCPDSSLGISISASSNTLTDTLSLYATFSTISTHFSNFALFEAPTPTTDSAEILMLITPDATEVGVHDFFIAINNNGAGGSCFDQVPIRTIVPGVNIPDFDVCSGQTITPEADTFPTTSFGSSSYSWSQLSGPTVTIANNTAYNPTITIPVTDSTSSNDSIVIELQFAYGSACGMTDTFVLHLPDIHVDLTSALDSVCVGDSSQLVAVLSDTINPSICDDYDVTTIPFAPLSGTAIGVSSFTATSSFGASDEGISAALPIGFNFNFYCNSYTNFYIHTNGFITFDNIPAASGLLTGVPIPTAGLPENLIALGWEDLDVSNGGSVDYFTTGTFPNRQLVVNFNAIENWLGGSSVTAQIILHESTNVIEVHTTNNTLGVSTIGIENSTGTLGHFPASSASGEITGPTSNNAYRFAPKTYGPFYSWSPPAFVTNSTISNPFAIPTVPTDYIVEIADGACVYADTVRVEIKGSLTAPTVTCGTTTMTDIDVTWTDIGLPAGGFYEYSIDGGATWVSAGTNLATTISSLAPSTTYTILIRGNDGLAVACSEGPAGNCSSTTLPPPSTCTATIDAIGVNPACNGSTDGCVQVIVSNNVGGLTYNWSNGATIDSICGLGAGMYVVTVTDTLSPGTPGTPGGPQIVFTENFNAATTTWTLNTPSGPNPNSTTNNNWQVALDEGGVAVGQCSDGGAGVTDKTLHITCRSGILCGLIQEGAVYNADPGNISNYRSESPVINTTGASGLTLNFDFISVGEGLNDNASVLYDDGLGAGFQILVPSLKSATTCGGFLDPSAVWESYSVALPASCDNNPNVRIAFNWTNDDNATGTDPSIAINNVSIIDSVSGSMSTPPVVCEIIDSIELIESGLFVVTLDSTHDASCFGNDGAVFITVEDTSACRSNIVTINEIFVNPSSNSDGNNPDAAEFVELLGPPGADISCYVFTDGDWTLTIPPGTTIPADGIFSIGNDVVWGAGTFDLDAENCGCFTDGTGGAGLLIFGNSGEYLAMFDGSGTFLQGVQYGSPSAANTAPNGDNSTAGVIATSGTAGCPTSVTIPAASFFETAPAVSNGTGISRNPDGNTNGWTNTLDSSVNACNALAAPTFTYLWSDGQTVEDATGLGGGNYTVTVTNAAGCTASVSATVNSSTGLAVTFDSTNAASCNATADGIAFISVSGGNPTYSYLWNDGQTIEDATGLMAGNYSVTVTDASGCSTTSGPHTVSEPTAVLLAVDSTQDASCSGQTDGAIYLSVSGGNPTYSFAWPGGQTTEDVTGLTNGSYTITATDANGCTDTVTAIISVPLPINISLNPIVPLCGGGSGSDGCIGATVTGGNGNFGYSWSNGASIDSICGLSNGTYIFTVTDTVSTGAGTLVCIAVDSVVINQPDSLIATIDSIVNVACVGDSTGTLRVALTGGTMNYDYLWSNGDTLATTTGLPSGTYCVTVTDVNGCTATTCDSISEPFFNIPQDTFFICAGDSVQILVNTNGSSISWTPEGTLSDSTIAGPFASPNTTTTYVVTVGGAEGNLIGNGDFESGNVGFTSQYTYGGATAGGYVIDTNANVYNGQHSGYDHTSGAGNYLIADGSSANNNVWCQSVTVTPNTNYDFSTWFNNIVRPTSNFGDPTLQVTINGSVILTTPAIPENPDQWLQFAATWNSGVATTADICISTVGASGGGHDFGIDDISFTGPSSCSMIDSITVIVSDPAVNITPVTIQCNGDSTGCVTATTTGGFGIYTYNWSNGNTTNNMCNLPAGSYTVVATDSLGCVDSLTYNMTQPAVLAATVDNTQDVSCGGGNDGAINVSVVGGTPAYNYDWSSGSTDEDLSNLGLGSYTLVVTDANNCTDTISTTISSASGISISDTSTQASCNGSIDGAINLVPIGGSTPYTYLWSNGATTEDLTAIGAGVYTVTLTDNSSCAIPYSVTITEPDALNVNLDSSSDPTCGVGNDGAINMTVTGGTGPVTLLWSTGQTTEDLTGLTGGTYNLTATDSLGCSATNGITLSPASDLTLSINTIRGILACDQVSIGELQAVASSSDTITYAWSNGATTATINSLAAGFYTVTVTTSTGCSAIATATVVAPIQPTVSAYVNNPGTTNAIIELGDPFKLNAGNNQTTQGVTYAWTYTGPTGIDAQIANATVPATTSTPDDDGDYIFVIVASATTDTVTCIDQDTLTVTVEERFDGVPDAFTPNEDGNNDLFRPIGLDATDIIEFTVYNRWGQVMYRGDDLNNEGWDGTFNNVAQPRDVYMYTLRFKERGDDKETNVKGVVTLIR